MHSLLPALLVALLLVFLQSRSGIDSYALTVGLMAVFSYVALAAGRLLAAAAGERDVGPAAAWALGLLAICLALYALTAIARITAGAAFGMAALAVIGLALAFLRRPHGSPDWRGLAGFALGVAFAAAWCARPAGAYEVLQTAGILPVWQDYFIHGGLISQFGDVRALGRGSIYLADHPSSFYHFGSYAGAAALAGLLDKPGLPLATSAWLPLGFLAMAAAAYVLGQRLAGAAGGLAALAAVAIVPDASNYGLRNGLFSFHWMLVSHPGGNYALAAAFMSLALLDRWNTERSRAALGASLVLGLSLFFFRAQIFLLFFPALLATATFCSVRDANRRTRTGLLLIAVLAAAAGAMYLLLPHLAAGGWRVRPGGMEIFFHVVHTAQEPTAYSGVYAALATRGGLWAIAGGVALTLIAALGAFVILLPAAVALGHRSAALRPLDAFVAYVVLWWLLLMLAGPEPWIGESTNLLFQPFVLVYAVAAIWTLCLPVRCIVARREQFTDRLWVGILCAALVALPAVALGSGRLAHPKFEWGQEGAARRVEPGLVEAAAFLRNKASVGDIFASSGLGGLFDLSTKVCALAGVPAYLSRPDLETIKDEPRKHVVAARLAALREAEQQTDYGEALRLLRGLPVQWYVSAGEQGPLWDPARARAAFTSGTVALYRIP